jgi:RNA polymerase sigma factor (sigma-70 family)
MAAAALDGVLRHIRGLAAAAGVAGCSDGELLARFAERHDEGAFEAILRRHGLLVLRVCQRVLRDPSAAEDAFQATFLILLQSTALIRKGESLASWLHGVAYRIAVRARTTAARERSLNRPPLPAPADPLSESSWREARAVIDEELNHLPERYRAPLLLCYFEGHTQEAASRLLGLPKGTLVRRLARGRKLLRARLTRRGVALSTGLLFLLLAEAAAARVPTVLVQATLRLGVHIAGAGPTAVIPARVATLLGEGMKVTGPAKLKVASALAVVLLGVGAGLFAWQPPAAAPAAKVAPVRGPAVASPPERGEGIAVTARATLERHGDVVWSAAFSPDGKTLATVGGHWGKTGEVILWDVASGKLRARVEDRMGVRAAAFSPDGKTLATADFCEGTIKLRDPASGEVRAALRDHNLKAPTVVNAIAFTPDGRTLVAGYLDGFVEIWDLPTRQVKSGFVGDPGGVYTVALCPTGQLLATGGKDQAVHLWELPGRRQVAVLHGHGGPVEALAFSPDGRAIASASWDRTVRLWEVVTGQERLALRSHTSEVLAVAFSPDGRAMASAGGQWGDQGPRRGGTPAGEARLWDVARGKVLASFPGHKDRVFAVTFTPDGTTLASAGWDRTAKLWDVPRFPAAPRKELTDRELDALWRQLGDRDAAKAYRALVALTGGPGRVGGYFKGILKPSVIDPGRITRLIAQLDDDAFAVRERASAELEKLGGLAKTALREALKARPSAEVRQRVRRLLDRPSTATSPEQLRSLRAVEVLERIGTREALGVLETLAKGAAEDLLTREAKASLKRLAKPAGRAP